MSLGTNFGLCVWLEGEDGKTEGAGEGGDGEKRNSAEGQGSKKKLK